MAHLGDLPGGPFVSVAEGVNVHDQVVRRSATEFNGHTLTEACPWHPGDGTVDLGAIPGGACKSEDFAINNAGQVTGWSSSAKHPGLEVFIWDAENGMRALGNLNCDSLVDFADAWALHALLTREPQQGRLIFP